MWSQRCGFNSEKKKCFGFLCEYSSGMATGKGKARPSRRKTRSPKSLPLWSAVLNPHQRGQVQAFTRPSSLIRKSCLTGYKSSSTCAKGRIKPNTSTKWDSFGTHCVVTLSTATHVLSFHFPSYRDTFTKFTCITCFVCLIVSSWQGGIALRAKCTRLSQVDGIV